MRISREVYLRRDRRRRASTVARAVAAATLCTLVAVVGARRAANSAVGLDAVIESEFERLRGELAFSPWSRPTAGARPRVRHWPQALMLASQYRVRPALASMIYEAAVSEGLDPDLGFRLVRVESQFNPRATSPVGAVGLAQVMLGTARYFDRGLTREQLYDERTNLRVGFRHLRGLVRAHQGDLRLALLVYNRGPVAVAASQRRGEDPSNGYDALVLRGYTGPGVVR